MNAVDVRTDLENLRSAHQALRRMTLRMHMFVLLGLLACCLLLPVITISDQRSPLDPGRLALLPAMRAVLPASPGDLGDLTTSPLAIPGGLALTKIGLLAITAGMIFALLGCRPLLQVPLRSRSAIMVNLTAFVFVLGAALVIVGSRWLPDSVNVEPAVGVVFPFATAVWLWHAAWSLRQLDWDWTGDAG